MVERNLAKVEVAGSSPVIRLKRKPHSKECGFFVSKDAEDEKTPASFKVTKELADTREKLAAHRVGRGSEPTGALCFR